MWTPAHRGLIGNEKADATARGPTFRAIAADAVTAEPAASALHAEPLSQMMATEGPSGYSEIMQYYRLARKTLPPADPQLSRKWEIYWRRLQAGAFQNPVLYSKWHHKVFDPTCKKCKVLADHVHMVWTCPSYKNPHRNVASWEALLLSRTCEAQRKIIGLALEAAESQRISAD